MHTPGPAATLHAEQQAAARLLELLQAEQQTLVEANVDALTALIVEKSDLVARMTGYARQRYSALAEAGFAADENGMQAWTESAAGAGAAAQWQALLDTARSAKEINRTNGLMINRQMALAQKSLQNLRGGDDQGDVYGRDGRSSQVSGSRNFVVG